MHRFFLFLGLLGCSVDQVRCQEVPQVVVATVRTSVIYRGVENPIEVAVPGVPCEGLSVSLSQGTIEGSGCSYTLKIDEDTKIVRLIISWEERGSMKNVERVMRVKEVPVPTACFAGSCDDRDTIPLERLQMTQGLVARLIGFEIDIVMKVVGYRLRMLHQCAVVHDEVVEDARLSQAMVEAIKQMKVGDELWLTGIRMQEPSGIIKDLAPLRLVAG